VQGAFFRKRRMSSVLVNCSRIVLQNKEGKTISIQVVKRSVVCRRRQKQKWHHKFDNKLKCEQTLKMKKKKKVYYMLQLLPDS